MKSLLKPVLLCVMVLGLVVAPVFAPATPAFADDDDGVYQGNVISVSKDAQGIYDLLEIVLTVLTFGVGAAGVFGLVVVGIMYMSSQGDPGKTATAKRRIIEIVIGLALWALLYSVLEFLIPNFTGTI